MRKRIIALLLCGALLGITGCSSGVSQEEYDKVVQERDDFKEKYEWLKEQYAEDQVDNLKNEIQSNIDSNNNNSTNPEDSTSVYEDDKVKISFAGVGEKGVEFWCENLTDVNITIQADSVSINGISTSDIMMSDDVAPKSTGKVVAKCEDFIGTTDVENVGGQLRIVDFSNSFETYEATFANVPIE